jgi:hypothetical protein
VQKTLKDELKPETGKLLEDIDFGKVKMTRYKDIDEYLKHVDNLLVE